MGKKQKINNESLAQTMETLLKWRLLLMVEALDIQNERIRIQERKYQILKDLSLNIKNVERSKMETNETDSIVALINNTDSLHITDE